MLIIQHPSPGIDPPYPVYGGLFHEEAIMLLRRFYIQENDRGKPLQRSSKIERLTVIASSPKPSFENRPRVEFDSRQW